MATIISFSRALILMHVDEIFDVDESLGVGLANIGISILNVWLFDTSCATTFIHSSLCRGCLYKLNLINSQKRVIEMVGQLRAGFVVHE